MASNSIKRDHHLWTKDTIKNVSGNVTLLIDGTTIIDRDITIDEDGLGTYIGLDVDTDKSGASTSDNTLYGLRADTNSLASEGGTNTMYGVHSLNRFRHATDSGTITGYGGFFTATGSTNGTSKMIGVSATATDADTNIALQLTTDSISGSNTGIEINCKDGGSDLKILSSADNADYFKIATTTSGATTLTTEDGGAAAANLQLTIDGEVNIDAVGNITLDSANNGTTLFQDAGTTYGTISAHHSASHFLLYENEGASTSDYLIISAYANGETMINTADGGGATAHLNFAIDGHINLNYNPDPAVDAIAPCATGFTQVTASFDATDTVIDFRSGNKQILTLTADITDVHFKFPAVSGNFLCVFLQDGTGGWDVSYWKTQDAAGNAGAGGNVRWAGGSAPSLTETADKADIISIYWDATPANEIAYGVVSENF